MMMTLMRVEKGEGFHGRKLAASGRGGEARLRNMP